jgi:hypothetical protein
LACLLLVPDKFLHIGHSPQCVFFVNTRAIRLGKCYDESGLYIVISNNMCSLKAEDVAVFSS